MATTRIDDSRLAVTEGRPELTAALAELVRERVRDEGLDPQADPGAVRGIADRVVSAHDRRSLTGAVDPLDDVAGLVDDLVASVSGFGALQPYLEDPTIEEVWINDPGLVC